MCEIIADAFALRCLQVRLMGQPLECLRQSLITESLDQEGPLLMQSVLSPFVGRLSDVLDRKYLATIPPLLAFMGACICAKATSMTMLIGGGIPIGATVRGTKWQSCVTDQYADKAEL